MMLAVFLGAFLVLNVVYTRGMSSSVDIISAKVQAESDRYHKLKTELQDKKEKLKFMAHVVDIKNILNTYNANTGKYNDMDFAYLIAKESFENNLDPFLVLAVIMTESSFRNTVVSHKGAIGLMQIRPETAYYVSDMHDHIDLSNSKELFLPDKNILIGINYLSYLVDRFNNEKYALIAYNMGPSNLIRIIRSGGTPPERYYRSVMKHYEQIVALSGRV